jgi:PAS domain S-box-containing protein
MVERSPFSIQIHATDGICIYVNRAWEDLWGVTLEQIQGYNILQDQQLVDKGVMPFIRRGFAGQTVAVPPIKYEPELTRPGAGATPYRWIVAYLYPIFDREGRVALVAMTGEDVTARIEAEAQLREAEEQYRGIFEATGDGLIITTEDNIIVEANPAFCRMHGYTHDALIGQHASLILHPDRCPHLEEANRAVDERGVYEAEGRDLRRNGSSFPVDVHATRVTYQGRPHILSVVRDISERQQAYEMLERRVAERTRQLSTLLDISRTVASTLDLEPLLDLILAQLKLIVDFTGASINGVEGDHIVVLQARGPGDVERMRTLRFLLEPRPLTWAMLNRDEPVIIDDVRSDTPLAQEFREVFGSLMDTTLSYVQAWMTVPLVLKDRLIGTLTLASHIAGAYGAREADLTQAVAAHAAVAIENARLYEQARLLATLEERQRLSRELHDSVSQALYGIALGIRTMRTLLDRPGTTLRSLDQPVDYVLALAEAALSEMRGLIFDLRPEALERDGLAAALTHHAQSVQARHHLVVDLHVGDEPEAPYAVKEALYRVAQEALNNIVKLARATRVEIWLRLETNALELEIADNGIGFDPGGSFPGHLGLHTMRERIEQLGGSLSVESTIGCGTRVVARLPTAATA